MNLIQTVPLETQINEFFLAHDFIVPYVLKEVGTKTQNINLLWHVVEFNIPYRWEDIDEIDSFMINKGFRSFPIAGKLAYIKHNA